MVYGRLSNPQSLACKSDTLLIAPPVYLITLLLPTDVLNSVKHCLNKSLTSRTFSIVCCQQSVTLNSSAVCSQLNCIQLVMHGQLVFLSLLYHIHRLIFTDSVCFYVTIMCRVVDVSYVCLLYTSPSPRDS